MRRLSIALLVSLLVPSLLAAGCGRKKRPSGFPAGELHDFKAKGLETTKFAETDPGPYGADKCAEGQVEGLAVLLCKYGDKDAAKAAEKKLLGFVQGAVTGLVRTRKNIAMVVADPDKMDLPGKNIAKLIKAFER